MEKACLKSMWNYLSWSLKPLFLSLILSYLSFSLIPLRTLSALNHNYNVTHAKYGPVTNISMIKHRTAYRRLVIPALNKTQHFGISRHWWETSGLCESIRTLNWFLYRVYTWNICLFCCNIPNELKGTGKKIKFIWAGYMTRFMQSTFYSCLINEDIVSGPAGIASVFNFCPHVVKQVSRDFIFHKSSQSDQTIDTSCSGFHPKTTWILLCTFLTVLHS